MLNHKNSLLKNWEKAKMRIYDLTQEQYER